MKRINFIFMMLALMLCGACSQHDEPKPQEEISTARFDKLREFARIHNGFLQEAVDKGYFDEENAARGTDAIGDEDAKPNYDELNRLQIEYARTLDIEPAEKELLCEALEAEKPYYETEKVFNEYFKRQPNGKKRIEEVIENIQDQGVIDAFECQLLKNLAGEIALANSAYGSPEYFQRQVSSLSSQWSHHYGFANEEEGLISGYVLAVIAESVDWWDDVMPSTRAVPWLAADAANGLKSAALNAVYQYVRHGSIKNWKSLGISTLSGAVVGSTGVMRIVGRWILRK